MMSAPTIRNTYVVCTSVMLAMCANVFVFGCWTGHCEPDWLGWVGSFAAGLAPFALEAYGARSSVNPRSRHLLNACLLAHGGVLVAAYLFKFGLWTAYMYVYYTPRKPMWRVWTFWPF